MATFVNLLRKFIAPALPQPPEAYEQRFFDKFNSILRIYFNQIDNAIGILLGGSGGQYLSFPYGAFSSYTSQALTAVNTGTIVTMTETDFANGITLNFQSASFTASISGTNLTVTAMTTGTILVNMTITDSGVTTGTRVLSQTSGTTGGVGVYVVSVSQTITSRAMIGIESNMLVSQAGIYNMQFSIQLQNLANSPQDAFVWLKQNGTDILGSTGVLGLEARKTPSDPYHDIKGWNYFLSMAAGDFIEIWWSTTDLLVTIPTYVASGTPTKPSTASVVATMTFVSAT